MRRPRILLASALLLTGVVPAAGPASAAPAPLPQGALVQLPGSTGCLASRASADARSGRCTQTSLGGFVSDVAVSPDGGYVYVGTGPDQLSSIVVFRRSRTTGALTELPGRESCHGGRGCPGSVRLRLNTPALVLTPDGRQLLTTNANYWLLQAYDRDRRTGSLRPVLQTRARALTRPSSVSVSPDGRSIYVASPEVGVYGLAVFRRIPATGAISQLPGEAGCVQRSGTGTPGEPCARAVIETFQPKGVAVSPDGRHVYVASSGYFQEPRGRVFAFARDGGTGALSPLPGGAACLSEIVEETACSPAGELRGARGVSVSGDGRNVYVTGRSVAVFARSSVTGRLTQVDPESACLLASGRVCPLTPAWSTYGLSLSRDGRTAYVSAYGSPLRVFARNPVTGALRQLPGRSGCVGPHRGCTTTRPSPAERHLAGFTSVTPSPDGSSAYAAGPGVRFAVFRRIR